ncbi:MAG: MBL fold metallo-hydrolase [Planctomycetaceae bacterium]|nr:MBL fold metallo-hydrolase [Planctomycetaceae bacterium]
MKLLFLGTAGYHPNEQRQTTCLMLPEAGIVLDAGTGLFRIRHHLQTSWLDIFLSHAHLDHTFGLTVLLDALYEMNVERVTVHGDAAKLHAIEQHLFATEIFPVPPPFVSRPLEQGLRLDCGARVTHFPLAHPGGSIGYRFDWQDRSLAFVTDTTSTGERSPYLPHIRGVDLLIHECNFRDGQEEWAEKTGHSSTTPVARAAAAAVVKRLVLIHFNPLDASDDPVGLAAARAIFPATELAYDGMAVEF